MLPHVWNFEQTLKQQRLWRKTLIYVEKHMFVEMLDWIKVNQLFQGSRQESIVVTCVQLHEDKVKLW